MDRLLTMDKQEYARRMQEHYGRMIEQVADAVNSAPTGNVISGSEMQVRNAMAEFRRTAFQTAVQMRVDSTESTFSPSGQSGKAQEGQGDGQPQDAERERVD